MTSPRVALHPGSVLTTRIEVWSHVGVAGLRFPPEVLRDTVARGDWVGLPVRFHVPDWLDVDHRGVPHAEHPRGEDFHTGVVGSVTSALWSWETGRRGECGYAVLAVELPPSPTRDALLCWAEGRRRAGHMRNPGVSVVAGVFTDAGDVDRARERDIDLAEYARERQARRVAAGRGNTGQRFSVEDHAPEPVFATPYAIDVVSCAAIGLCRMAWPPVPLLENNDG